jgi:NAD(P)-dependent dehydrogenase (short-subunit alcohol dehydrogenase family)
MTAPFDLTGRLALVTGTSRGMGPDLAVALADAGATVLAGVRRRADLPPRLAEDGRIRPLELDVTDIGGTRAAIDRAVAEHGAIDILVNNAGIGAEHDALEVPEVEWDRLVDVNLKGTYFVTQAVARHMAATGYGRVIMISSQAGRVGLTRSAVYCGTKAGLDGIVRSLAVDWAPLGITVNSVAPTWIYTTGTAERLDDPAFRAEVLAHIPVGRLGSPADVAAAVLYLASDEAGLVTGIVLSVDGGWTAQCPAGATAGAHPGSLTLPRAPPRRPR